MFIKDLFHIELPKDRVFGLDLLRALAILFVLLEHGNILLPPFLSKFINWFILDGVTIFFVLSGYLIGRILIRELIEKPVDLSSIKIFLKRRWWRTLPNYYLVLLILVILRIIVLDSHPNISIWKYVFFIQNMFEPHPGFFPEAWSLSIEEWFYFSIPFLILLITRIFSPNFIKSNQVKRNLYLIILIILIITIHLIRYNKFSSEITWNYKNWDLYFRKMIFTRFDSILIGLVSAWFSWYHSEKWKLSKNVLLICGIALLIIYQVYWNSLLQDYNNLFTCVFSFSVLSIATAFLLPFLSEFRLSKTNILTRLVTVFSLTSYSMYLINLSLVQGTLLAYLPVHRLFSNELSLAVIRYGLFFTLTIFISIIQYKYFEKPMTKRRDR